MRAYSFLHSLSLLPSSLGPLKREEGMRPQSLEDNPTFKCFSPQATQLLVHSSGSSFRVCIIQVSASTLQFPFVDGEVNIPTDESVASSVPDVSRATPSSKAFIASAVRPQNFHSIVTPNKHPNCKSCGPAQTSPLHEISFVGNERLTGCLDI